MPKYQEFIQIVSDGAESTAKDDVSFLDQAFCNDKEGI